MSFGDHATIITGGSGNSVAGQAPPPGRGGWSGTGRIVVGVATVVSAVLAAVTLWVTWPDSSPGGKTDPPGNPGAAVVPPETPAGTGTAAAPEVTATARPAPATVYDGVLTLNRHTGFDLDAGRATRQSRQDAATDLYLGDYLAIHATDVYQDSYGGDSGAYDRCRGRRESGGTPLPQAIGIGSTQYCFSSSAGRPGWLRVTRMQSADDVLVKVVLWAR
jgi:hypothetical protein